MFRKISLFLILITFSIFLEAAPPKNKIGKRDKTINKYSVMEELNPDQRKEMMNLKALSMQEESKINDRLRYLRNEMNKCMLSENPDMKKFEKLQNESMMLKKERHKTREKYTSRMHKIMGQQPK